MRVLEPFVRFHVQLSSGATPGALELIADPDLVLRSAFLEIDFNVCGGLLIAANGKPWNSTNQFDTHENLCCWFEGVARTIESPAEPISVWAWEESDCEISIEGPEGVSIRDSRAGLARATFGRQGFLRAFLRAGRELEALQQKLHGRVAEILGEPGPQGIPKQAWVWCGEIPPEDLSEKVARKSKLFVWTEGRTPARRWQRALATRIDPGRRARLSEALRRIESAVSIL